MPIHDWTRVTAADFHHFHQHWISALAAALNRGGLPPEFMAMSEQVTGRPIPDVVTLQTSPGPKSPAGGTATLAAPSARVVQKIERVNYAKRQDRVAIRHGRGRVVAIIELLSPGNKEGRHAFRSFVEKSADILSQGINLLVVDLFPPTPRDPQGIHRAVLDEFAESEPFDFLPDKPLTVASYIGGDRPTAYVDSLAVGDPLPASPLFLTEFDHVPCPLEASYAEAWANYPALLREIVETGVEP